MNVLTMLPTASLLSLGFIGLLKFLIFSGESSLTLTLATILPSLLSLPSLWAALLVLRELLGEWKS